MNPTTLALLVQDLDHIDDELTIYAEGGSSARPNARAVVMGERDDGSPPPTALGLEYVLEVFIAKEVIDVWSQWRDGRRPTPAEALGAILYYAEHDAFEPATDQADD